MARLVTQDEALQMCQLYRAGHSLLAVGRATGRSSKVIKRVLRRYEIPVRSWQREARIRPAATTPEPKPKPKPAPIRPGYNYRSECLTFYGTGRDPFRECEVETWDAWNERRAV